MPSIFQDKKNFPYHHVFSFILFVISFGMICLYPNPIIFDQNCITFALTSYPSFTDGIITFLTFGLYNKLIHPPLEMLNTHIRIFSMMLYVASAYFLANSLLTKRRWIIVFMLLLISSRFPFLWLSRELIAGAFFIFVVAAFVRGWNQFLICFLLVILAHVKPEVLLISFAFMGMLVWRALFISHGPSRWEHTDKKRFRSAALLIVLYLVGNILIASPEILGRNKIDTGRAFFSFGQHYADLVDRHQLKPTGDGFSHSLEYVATAFPDAKDMKDVILKYPKKYYDFIWLSIGHGVKRVIVLFHVFLFFIFIIYRNVINKAFQPGLFGKLLLLSLVGMIPLVMFSYPHIRYLARYYPLFILFILYFLEKCQDEKELKVANFVLILGLIINVLLFLRSLSTLSEGNYWMPD